MSKEIREIIKPPEDVNDLEILRRVLETGREAIEAVNAKYDIKPRTFSTDHEPSDPEVLVRHEGQTTDNE